MYDIYIYIYIDMCVYIYIYMYMYIYIYIYIYIVPLRADGPVLPPRDLEGEFIYLYLYNIQVVFTINKS